MESNSDFFKRMCAYTGVALVSFIAGFILVSIAVIIYMNSIL